MVLSCQAKIKSYFLKHDRELFCVAMRCHPIGHNVSTKNAIVKLVCLRIGQRYLIRVLSLGEIQRKVRKGTREAYARF